MTSATERRNKILDMLEQAGAPVSGEMLGREVGVSRQMIVQDIALLRAEGHPVLSTARGYIIERRHLAKRLFKVRHTKEEIEDELTIIVDHGGYIEDVMINHRIYGKISAKLGIKSRRDIAVFLNDLKSGKSGELAQVTSGYHYHLVYAENEQILDEIQKALEQRNYLAEFLPYEIP